MTTRTFRVAYRVGRDRAAAIVLARDVDDATQQILDANGPACRVSAVAIRCDGLAGDVIRSPKPQEQCRRFTTDGSGRCPAHRRPTTGA